MVSGIRVKPEEEHKVSHVSREETEFVNLDGERKSYISR
jgi:hypothetical protein